VSRVLHVAVIRRGLVESRAATGGVSAKSRHAREREQEESKKLAIAMMN